MKSIEFDHGIYKDSCINCGRDIGDYRLSRGLPCKKCLPSIPKDYSIYEIYKTLKNQGKLTRKFRSIYNIQKDLDKLEEIYKKILDSRPWSAQKTWAIRVFKGNSFSIVAPTGVGKTLFGMIMGLFISGIKKKGKSLFIVPTTPLVEQVYNRVSSYAKKIHLNIKILSYHTRIKNKRKILECIEKGDYNILVATSQFLSRRFNLLENKKFYFIFVDDVDAILKNSKNIDKILKLLGFTDREIKASLNLVQLKTRLLRTREEEKKPILKEIKKLQELINKRKRKTKGILIVSSATGKPRGTRVKIFRELLGFQIGYRPETLRNVIDTYINIDHIEQETLLIDLIKKLGSGGLIFVPVDKGIEYAEKIVNLLKENDVSADLFTSGKLNVYEKYVKGEIDVLVGVAIYYGVMVRGLDLLTRIRYSIFLGVPRFKFSARFKDPNPIQMLKTLAILKNVVDNENETRKIDSLMRSLNRIIKTGSYSLIQRISKVLLNEKEGKTKYEKMALEALAYIRNELMDNKVRDKLKKLDNIQILEHNQEFYIMIPDLMTYIQASGRTSRLYAGGITKGLSIILIDYPKLFNGLVKKMKWLIEDVTWKEFKGLDIKKIIKLIDRDRENVKMILKGELRKEIEDPVKTALMVVESPNKARTIARFFGKPTIRKKDSNIVYEISIGNLILMITSSGGHIYNLITLPKNEELEKNILYGVYLKNGRYIPIYNSIKYCLNCRNQFTSIEDKCPKCKSRYINTSTEKINFMRDLAIEVDEVYIATDPDVEGEKIGWDIAMLLRPYTKNIFRLEFHEITRKAILNALKNKRTFNIRYVEAQIVRRIEDRWIGFTLSGKLKTEFRKIIGEKRWFKYKKGEWSAGRVQTPVLGWIVKRWEEVMNSKRKVYIIQLPKNIYLEIAEKDTTKSIEDLYRTEFEITGTEKYIEEINPPPPFTTDTMITEANKTLKLGAEEIMKIAQDLFEQGLITYHRTDSIRVSDTGIKLAREYLKNKFRTLEKTLFKPRKWGERGAHECIRPTKPIDTETLITLVSQGDLVFGITLTKNHYKLYSLIFNRFIASQMRPSKIVKQKISIHLDGQKIHEEDRILEVIEKGFLHIYGYVRIKDEILGELNSTPISIKIKEKYLIGGYTQGDIIGLMKKREIGRPSTYAKIVKTLLQRKYVFESSKARWLIPREKGKLAFQYLSNKYGNLVSEERTRLVEKYMKEIEVGIRDYQKTLRELYEEVKEIEKPEIELEEIIEEDTY